MQDQKKDFYPHDDEDERILFDDEFSVASSMECTGLIPAAPANESEVKSYREIYDIPLADKSSQKKNRNDKK